VNTLDAGRRSEFVVPARPDILIKRVSIYSSLRAPMIFTIAVELPTFKHMEPSQPSLLG
jgi:hypothetical protein